MHAWKPKEFARETREKNAKLKKKNLFFRILSRVSRAMFPVLFLF